MAENTLSESKAPDDRQSTDMSVVESRSWPSSSGTISSSGPEFSFRWLLILFLAFRLLALLLLRPGGFIRDWSDFDTFLGIAAISDYGLYPFLHYWLEWPPIVPWLAVGAYKLSLLFPPWPDDYRLWFVLILGSVFVLFETGNLVLLYRISCRLYARLPTAAPGQSSAPGEVLAAGNQVAPGNHADGTSFPAHDAGQVLRPVWLYTILFIPIYAMLGFFDAVALFFLLLGLELILRGRLFSSAASVAFGFLVKVTPILMVPVALRHLWDSAESRRESLQDCALFGMTTLLTILALSLPFLLTQPAWLLTTARAIMGRSSWETVWAVMEGYLGFGAVGGDRLNPAETSFAIHDSILPWGIITLAFAIFYLIAWTRPADYRRPRNVVAFAGLTITLFLLYSKGYSPQFLVYLLPFVILLFPSGRGVAYCLLLTLLNVLEQPVHFVLVPDARGLLVAIVVARWLTLGALLLEFSFVLWGPGLSRLAVVRRWAPLGLSALVGLGLVLSIPSVARSYAQRQLRQDPAAPLIGYLDTHQARAQASTLLVTEQDLLRRLTPYVGNDYALRLAGGDRLYAAAPTWSQLVADADRVWLVTSDASVAGETGRTLLTYDFNTGYGLQLFATKANVVSLPPVARLGSGANLVGYEIKRPSQDQVLVTLYWWATTSPVQSYTVFTHLLDTDGQFVAGHDGFPGDAEAPTHTWEVGHVYADPHLIELPPDLVPGRYGVVTGMYDVNLRRVTATGPDALVFDDNAVPLDEIRLP